MHGRVYVGERHWQAKFECIVAKELATFFEQYDASKDRFWMVQIGGQFVASVTVAGVDERLARLRFFVADPEYVGQGFGKQLMEKSMQFCAAGHKDIYLTTVKGLDAARHLYEQAGFALVAEHEDHSWGSAMTEQRWEKHHARA